MRLSTSDCYACSNNAWIGSLPPREENLVEGGWRVAHAFGSSLPGWLVVVPVQHVTALHQLSFAELAAFGPILGRLSGALEGVLGAEKAYVVFFAEAEGFAHLHVHVVPRMPWFAPEQQGPRVFSLLGVAEADEVPVAERDALALRLREALVRER